MHLLINSGEKLSVHCYELFKISQLTFGLRLEIDPDFEKQGFNFLKQANEKLNTENILKSEEVWFTAAKNILQYDCFLKVAGSYNHLMDEHAICAVF